MPPSAILNGGPPPPALVGRSDLIVPTSWENLNEALIAYGREFIEALNDYLTGNTGALTALDPALRDLPDSFANYLRGPAAPLLHVHNLDEYLYASEASSGDTRLFGTDRAMAGLKQKVRTFLAASGSDDTAAQQKASQEALERVSILQRELQAVERIPDAAEVITTVSELTTALHIDFDYNEPTTLKLQSESQRARVAALLSRLDTSYAVLRRRLRVPNFQLA